MDDIENLNDLNPAGLTRRVLLAISRLRLDLGARIYTLEEKVMELTTSLDNLRAAVDAQTAMIGTVRDNLAGIRSDLVASLTTAQEALAASQANDAADAATIAELEQTIADMLAAQQTAVSRIADMQAVVTANTGTVDTLDDPQAPPPTP